MQVVVHVIETRLRDREQTRCRRNRPASLEPRLKSSLPDSKRKPSCFRIEPLSECWSKRDTCLYNRLRSHTQCWLVASARALVSMQPWAPGQGYAVDKEVLYAQEHTDVEWPCIGSDAARCRQTAPRGFSSGGRSASRPLSRDWEVLCSARPSRPRAPVFLGSTLWSLARTYGSNAQLLRVLS